MQCLALLYFNRHQFINFLNFNKQFNLKTTGRLRSHISEIFRNVLSLCLRIIIDGDETNYEVIY